MNRELLSQKLKELRIVNNYTQDYVAAALGVVRQTYSHYETGRRVPDAEVLYKLSEYLDFYNEPSNRKKYMFATPIEKELLYHFKKMSEEDRNEMIEIAKIKARKNPEKEK